MGYEKEKGEKDLNAANGNLDLAIEYLSSGNIPERSEQTQSTGLGNNSNNSNLPFELKKNASIMKIVCQRDPNKIISILNNMKDRDPTTLNLIKQHEEEFKRLLVSPISQEDITIFRNFQQELRARRTGGVKINLTKEESEAVKRLQDLGNFSKSEVLQAFIACDKNEELTANYLFEQKLKEEDETNKNNNNNNQGQGQ
jgi:UV excision repair protein RAD23